MHAAIDEHAEQRLASAASRQSDADRERRERLLARLAQAAREQEHTAPVEKR